MDIYSTRAQLAAIELQPRIYTFLYDVFAHENAPVEDDKAIYDFRKGTERMAPVVHPGAGGVVMPRDGFSTREIGFATIAPERIIENSDLVGRAFGEKILGAMTPQERERKMLVKDQVEMREAIQRRREHMVRQVLLTGKLGLFQYTNEGRDSVPTVVADYSFTNNFTPTTAWDQSGAKINDDMKAIYDMVYDGGGNVNIIVVAPDVANAMLANDAFLKLLDLKNAEAGDINARYLDKGVRFVGTNIDGVQIYSLSGKFLDDDGQRKDILPSGTVIAGSRGMLEVYHGPVTQVEQEDAQAQHKTYIKKEVPLRYGSIASNAIKNRITSRPTVVPRNVDGWVVGNVL